VKDQKHYAKAAKIHPAHRAYTNWDMQLDITASDLIFTSDMLLDEKHFIRHGMKAKIDEALGTPIAWHLRA